MLLKTRRRAVDYAGALGLSAGDVAWVAEPGLRLSTPGGSAATYAVARAAGPSAVAAGEPIDINPEQITVRAVVEVAFTIASG